MPGQQTLDIKLLSSLLSGFKIISITERENTITFNLENKCRQAVSLKAEIVKDTEGKGRIHLSVSNVL